MTCAEGLAFLISAMSRIGPPVGQCCAEIYAGGAAAASAKRPSKGSRCRAAATSCCFETTISSRIVIIYINHAITNHVCDMVR